MSKDLVKKGLSNANVNSPAALIQQAVAGGADLEKLKGLMELQERWDANEARKAYHKAMAEFKANPPKIDKDQTVKYKEVKYSHASLANVTEKINEALSKCGLSASWSTKQNGAVIVTCKITHVQGHSEETSLSAPADVTGSKNPIQAIGSTITYLERYTLLALTGLATYEQDDDAKDIDVKFIDEKQLNNIVDLLASLDVGQAKFCKFMKVEKLEDIPASDYQKAIVSLDAKMVATQRKEGQKK